MKAFNLEEYLKNPKRKVVTRDGRNVRIVCTDVKSELYPVLALVDNWGKEICNSYTKEGRFRPDNEAHRDLFFAPEKHEGWFNIYHSDESGFYVRQYHPYKSKDEADEIAKANHRTLFTTVKIEWEE